MGVYRLARPGPSGSSSSCLAADVRTSLPLIADQTEPLSAPSFLGDAMTPQHGQPGGWSVSTITSRRPAITAVEMTR